MYNYIMPYLVIYNIIRTRLQYVRIYNVIENLGQKPKNNIRVSISSWANDWAPYAAPPPSLITPIFTSLTENQVWQLIVSRQLSVQIAPRVYFSRGPFPHIIITTSQCSAQWNYVARELPLYSTSLANIIIGGNGLIITQQRLDTFSGTLYNAHHCCNACPYS